MSETDSTNIVKNIAYYDHDLNRPAISYFLNAFQSLTDNLAPNFSEINDIDDCNSQDGMLNLENRSYDLALVHGPVEPWFKCAEENSRTIFLFVSSMVSSNSADHFDKLKTAKNLDNIYLLNSSYTSISELKTCILRLLNCCNSLDDHTHEKMSSSQIQSIRQHITSCSFAVSEYIYKEQFEELWHEISVRAQQIVEDDRHQEYIIHFNGIPQRPTDSPVALENFLTPIDYAVALSLNIHKIAKNLSIPAPSFCIQIIDETATPLSAPSWNFLRHTAFSGNCALIPWVRIYSGLPATPSSWADLNDLTEHLSCSDFSESMPNMRSNLNKDNLQIIISVWQAFILNSADGSRHSLANIMGPLLLLNDTEFEQDPQLYAMRVLLRELALLPGGNVNQDSNLSQNRSWLDSELISTFSYISLGIPIPVLLIDDQYAGEQAWGKIIAYALGAKIIPQPTDANDCSYCKIAESPLFTLQASSSPDCILLWLESRETLGNLRFVTDFGLKGLGVIFLDLRLHSGKSLAEELSVFNRILEQCRRLMGQNTNLPWKGFSEDELASIQNWVDSTPASRDNPLYIQALTLLPRLLSLIDPTLPIILFTSTGRRAIVNTLEPYGNVFCGLEKPRIGFSEEEHPADQCKRQFTAVLDQAGALLDIRRKLNASGTTALIKNTSTPTPPRENAYAVLYIDESGDGENNRMVVAGILAVCDNEKKLHQFNIQLLADKNLHWGESGILKKRGPDAELDQFGDSALAILKEAESFGINLYAVCAIQSPENNNKFAINALADDSFLDNRYRSLLELLVETVMFQSAPLLLNGRIDILPEVRSKTYQDTNFNLNNKFGIKPAKDSIYHILQPQEVIGIVSQLISRYAKCGIYSSVEANVVKGCIIPDDNNADKYKHQLHHLTDWLAHYLYKFVNSKKPLPEWIQQLLNKEGSYTVVDNKTTENLLACHSALNAGETRTALMKYLEPRNMNFRRPNTLEFRLIASASEAMASLPGYIYIDCSKESICDITTVQMVLETTVIELKKDHVILKDKQTGQTYAPYPSNWNKIEKTPELNDTVFCTVSFTMDGQKRVKPIATKDH